MQKHAENRSRRQCSRASASEAMTLMARPLMALKIDCRALTNRVCCGELWGEPSRKVRDRPLGSGGVGGKPMVLRNRLERLIADRPTPVGIIKLAQTEGEGHRVFSHDRPAGALEASVLDARASRRRGT